MTVFDGVIVIIGIWVLFLAVILSGAKNTPEKSKIDPDEEEEENYVCRQCNGSGEGMYDGTRCPLCHGSGEDVNHER